MYKLSIQFDPNDTKDLNSNGFKVVITKGVVTLNTATDPILFWVAFEPFEINSITWEAIYGVYASPDAVQTGTMISASSGLYPAKPGIEYQFEEGVFDTGPSSSTPNSYIVKNNSPDTKLTFGLTQTVTANGRTFDAAPVNGVVLDSLQTQLFSPTEQVTVFLYKEVVSGGVIAREENAFLTLEMEDNLEQNIFYKDGTFSQRKDWSFDRFTEASE